MKETMRRLLLLPLFLLAAIPASAQCNLNATTANFAAQLSALPAGQTLCLASGNYGKFPQISKTALSHVQPSAGANVSFSGADFSTSTKNIYVHGPVSWTGPVEIASGSGGLNLWLEGTWANVGHADHEGRISIFCSSGCGAANVHIMNSMFGPGGCSDGIQISAPGVEVGFSEFFNINQGSCSEHVDPIQLYGGNQANIHDVYIHGSDQGIMGPDGSVGTIIRNSVVQADNNFDLVLGNIRDAVIENNVADADVYDGNPANQPTCTQRKSTNVVYRNNVGTMAGCGTNITNTNNQSNGVTFVGGPGRCGFKTASPLGTGTGGTTIGLNDCGAPPPPQVNVTVSPATSSLQVNQTQPLTATVTNSTDPSVTWTTNTGTIAATSPTTAIYTAPATATTSRPRATSVSDTSKFAESTITVTALPPPPTFPAPGKCLKTIFAAAIRDKAVNNGFGVQIGSAPLGATGCILAVTNALIPNAGGATWTQVDFNDPSLPTGYIGSNNMTESSAPPPPPTLTVNCPVAKLGFTGTNLPAGSTITITGVVAGAPTASCTTSLP